MPYFRIPGRYIFNLFFLLFFFSAVATNAQQVITAHYNMGRSGSITYSSAPYILKNFSDYLIENRRGITYLGIK